MAKRKAISSEFGRLDMVRKPKKDDTLVFLTRIHHQYNRHARTRGLIFDLDLEEIAQLVFAPCFYCADPCSNNMGLYRRTDLRRFAYNGIDRIDSLLGYTAANVVSCCRTCNRAKSNLLPVDWLCWLDRVVKNYVPDTY